MRATGRRWMGVCCAMAALACTGSSGGGTGSGGDGGAPVTPTQVPGDGASGADGGSTAGTPPGDGGTIVSGATDGGTADGGTPGPGTGGTPGGTDGGTVASAPPITWNGWTFYGSSQGLSQDVSDVSADEGGNVYVAGGDAVYAKRRDDTRFLRFDAQSSGLTQNCYAGVPPEGDPSFSAALDGKLHPTPPGPAVLCPVISVAGAAAGTAAIGFKGHGTDGEPDADWAQDGGGMDVVRFDGTQLTRARHVFIASPPQTVCAAGGHEQFSDSCSNPWEYFWVVGRRKLRQVDRIVVNHQAGSPMYGDMFMGGTHASIAALLANAGARGYPDHTAGQPAKWADAKDTWEHDHPAFYDPGSNQFLTNQTYALAIHPRSGIPWVSNGVRTAYLTGYGADLHSNVWWLLPQTAGQPLWIDIWPDPGPPTAPTDPLGASADHVESLSFCDDGSLWAGSSTHGLAVSVDGTSFSTMGLPDYASHGDSVYAVACDPSDHSLWIGLGWGGVMRYHNGAFTTLDPNTPGLPDFVRQPVRSIQIDRWSNPRTVYFAFMPTRDVTGKIVKPGGVAAYAGP